MTRSLLALSFSICSLLATMHAAHARERRQPCFLLQELGGRELARENPRLCAERLSPASTFKIPHALVALETAVIPDEHVVFHPPDGVRRKEAMGDHDLASAIHFSVVWYFQHLARLIGPAREAEWLTRLDYGNRDASGAVDQFWLDDGRLRISPDEQMKFLQRFFAGTLPASGRSQALVKKLLEQDPQKTWAAGRSFQLAPWPKGAVLRAKSGTGDHPRRVSWYVGELERDGKQYLFVTCIAGASKVSAAQETFARLKAAGLL